MTAASAFTSVWILYWVRGSEGARWSVGRVTLAFGLLVVTVVLIYAYARRQWLYYLRRQALEAATDFVSKSQAFDAAASAAVTLIQEVELVSRGYRMLVFQSCVLQWPLAH